MPKMTENDNKCTAEKVGTDDDNNEEPPKKKSRQEGEQEVNTTKTNEVTRPLQREQEEEDIIRPEILQDVDNLSASSRNAKPYPHGVLENVYVDGFLGKCL